MEKAQTEERAGAAKGNGCAHCERGKPIEEISSRAGGFELCLECVLGWWPGKDVAWWEERHSVFADHITMAIKAARQREFDRLMFSTQGKDAREALGMSRLKPWRS